MNHHHLFNTKAWPPEFQVQYPEICVQWRSSGKTTLCLYMPRVNTWREIFTPLSSHGLPTWAAQGNGRKPLNQMALVDFPYYVILRLKLKSSKLLSLDDILHIVNAILFHVFWFCFILFAQLRTFFFPFVNSDAKSSTEAGFYLFLWMKQWPAIKNSAVYPPIFTTIELTSCTACVHNL